MQVDVSGYFQCRLQRREHSSVRGDLSSCEKKAYISSSQQHKLRLLLQWSFRHLFVNLVIEIYEIYVFIISMQVIKFGEFLNPRTYTQIHTTTVVKGRDCLVPRRLSLDKNVRAKEGRKETTGARSLHLPFAPLPWSLAVHYQWLAITLRKTKKEKEAEGGAVVDGTPPRSFCHVAVFRNDFTFSGRPLIFLTRSGIFYGWWRCWWPVTSPTTVAILAAVFDFAKN